MPNLKFTAVRKFTP